MLLKISQTLTILAILLLASVVECIEPNYPTCLPQIAAQTPEDSNFNKNFIRLASFLIGTPS